MAVDKQQAEEIAKARRQFLAAVASGGVKALDRFANEITEGASLLYRPPFDLVFQVTNVGPSLDHNMPPGIMVVTLTVTVPVQIRANMPSPTMLVVAGVGSGDKPNAPQTQNPDAAATLPADTASRDGAEPGDPEASDR